MKLTCFLILFFPLFIKAQTVLVLGKNVPLQSKLVDLNFTFSDSLDSAKLNTFSAVFIFSTANSQISERQEKVLISYLKEGGSLYLGAENAPFYAESNQLLKSMFNLQFYGNFQKDTLEIDANSNLKCERNSEFSSGYSTVSFPVDYRFKVEAWSLDNPIILSTQVGKGKLILDGGYSRFYDLETQLEVLDRILFYLLKKD